MPRRPMPERGETRAQSAACALISGEVLPRLLRAAQDPDVEAKNLLAAIRRRVDDRDSVATLSFVRQIVAAAVDNERNRRMTELGTDGTP